MYNQLSNRRCSKQRYNQYQQCSNLNGKVIPSCINVYGMDGWPPSTPQQSSAPYTNGISGFSPPNGFKQYLQPMYLYNFRKDIADGGTLQLFKPHHRFIYNSDVMTLKSGKTTYVIDEQTIVLVEDLINTQLRLFNVFGIYRNGGIQRFMKL